MKKADNTVEEKVQRILDEISESRMQRLARGNLLLQRGMVTSDEEIQKMREEQPARMVRLKEFFGI